MLLLNILLFILGEISSCDGDFDYAFSHADFLFGYSHFLVEIEDHDVPVGVSSDDVVVRLRGADPIILASRHCHGDVEGPLRRERLDVPFVVGVIPEFLDFEDLGVDLAEYSLLKNFIDEARGCFRKCGWGIPIWLRKFIEDILRIAIIPVIEGIDSGGALLAGRMAFIKHNIIIIIVIFFEKNTNMSLSRSPPYEQLPTKISTSHSP